MDFKIVKDAGLTQTELAIILGVSRLTAHKYLHGAPVSDARRPVVAHALNVIDALVKKGKLPLAGSRSLAHRSKEYNKEKRVAAAHKIADHVKNTLAYN